MFVSSLRVNVCALVALFVACSAHAADPAAPAKPATAVKSVAKPAATTVELFAGMESGDLEVKVFAKDATGGNITIKNKTDKPLTIKMPEAFAGVPLMFQREFGIPTAFQNDANAAAFGEYWAGAGKGVASMVLFTLGTGIGGGVILDGKVLEGRHSHGAELGHTKIEMTRPRQCGCGRWGCLEAYASATAVVRRAHEALNEDEGRSALHDIVREYGELTAREVFETAAGGDK